MNSELENGHIGVAVDGICIVCAAMAKVKDPTPLLADALVRETCCRVVCGNPQDVELPYSLHSQAAASKWFRA